jgi:bacillithiol biosynthesis cysteine-adding enzyme BshC
MTLRVVATPLADRIPLPSPRDAAWDSRLNPAVISAPGTEPALARLQLPGALVVTTGQQPGLFTGPAYTIAKALSARALAAELERRWGRPVVPLFWIPGDDHDFDEVAWAAWIAADGEMVRGALPPRRHDAPLTPMARQPLGPEVAPLLDRFEASFADQGTSGPTVAWLRRHYRPEQTVAAAFGGAMAELLAPLGMLCLDSTHPAVKSAIAPWILQALARSAELDLELAARSAALVAAGGNPGVPVGDGATLAFLESAGGRDRLVGDGAGGFVTRRGREPFTRHALEEIARTEPSRLSGNVLLRPVLESAVLPTVAYVAGPGELRYLALAEAVYQRLEVPRQLPVPRWSGLLLEPRVSRILAKFGATLEDLQAEGEQLERRLARAAMPAGTEQALAGLRASIEAAYAPVIAVAAAADPKLVRPAESARARSLFAVERLEKKLIGHARRRESVELAQATRARLSVRPLGKPQERVLTMAGFLARYGEGLLDLFGGEIDAWYRGALEAAPPSL